MNNRKRTALCLLGAALCVFMTFGAALALGRYPITPAALLAGDAFNVLVEALRNTDASSEAMADYLKNNLKDYSGITGTFSFSATGDRVGDLYQLYTVSPEGKFVIKQ